MGPPAWPPQCAPSALRRRHHPLPCLLVRAADDRGRHRLPGSRHPRHPALSGRPERGRGRARRGSGRPLLVGRCRLQCRGGPRVTPRAARPPCSPARSPSRTLPSCIVAGVAAVAPVTSLTELAPAGAGSHRRRRRRLHGDGPLRLVGHYRDLPLTSVLTPAGLRDGTADHLGLQRHRGLRLRRGYPPTRFFKPGWSTNPAVRPR